MRERPFGSFVTVARDVFRFLEAEFGCVLESAGDNADRMTANVIFKNETTFVDVHLERVDARIILYVGALANKAVPPQGAGWFDLDFILYVRGIPFPSHRGRVDKVRSAAGRRRELEEYAAALQLGAHDVLNGDFAIFELVKAIHAERSKFLWEPQVKSGRLI
jgi:hypothetical protein